jgi:hypothetical protein
MKEKHFTSKILTTALFLIAMLVIVLNFNIIFPALRPHSLVITTEKKNNPTDIPSNLNFLNDDKNAFLEYCKGIYGEKLPLAVNNDTFVYYGTVDGYRLYRMQSNLIPYERVQQSEEINGHIFFSDCIYHPSRTGLYIVSEQSSVFTLDEAYKSGIIDIDDVYDLYLDKITADYPGLKKVLKSN